jgi:long-chain acyl-CoA synthetase
MGSHQLRTFADVAPDRPAVIMGAGTVVTFRELEERSNRLAQYLYRQGLRPGDHIAAMLENNERVHEVVWAAQRSGLYWTLINNHLTPEEAAYIVEDCGARVLITSTAMAAVAEPLSKLVPFVERRLVMHGEVMGFERYEELVEGFSSQPLDHEEEGTAMLYSSGTTGRPKGILRPLSGTPYGEAEPFPLLGQMLGFGEGDIYLSPAPLYHAAPIGWSMAAQRGGGTVVVMERFDAGQCLDLIEARRVTHGQFVPTMFVRMLKLPEERRARADTSSLEAVVHAAAPCPVDVKRRMIDWWGPIIHEYYAGTEGGGITWVTSAEWLDHPGSVGRFVLGAPHILDDDGRELPVGEPGVIWFEADTNHFEYHNDPAKTRETFNDRGWFTLWDIGYLDAEGYLYLTDRKLYMIVSGGVNVYPQEAEDVLVMHPKVADVAVIGVPSDEMGQEVKAVVQPAAGVEPDASLESELIEFCRDHLAHYKCPRSVDFDPALPRLDTGKLYKRLLLDRYWSGRGASRIV